MTAGQGRSTLERTVRRADDGRGIACRAPPGDASDSVRPAVGLSYGRTRTLLFIVWFTARVAGESSALPTSPTRQGQGGGDSRSIVARQRQKEERSCLRCQYMW